MYHRRTLDSPLLNRETSFKIRRFPTLTVLKAGCYTEVLPREGDADQGQTGSIFWSIFRCNT